MAESLAQLVNESNEIMLKVIESDGELTPDLETIIDLIKDKIESKADSYAFVIKRLEKEIEFYKSEADQYKKHAKSLESLASNMKERIKWAMIELDKPKIGAFTVSNTQPALIIDDSKDIPEEFIKTEIVRTPDKVKIKEFLLGGGSLEFACLRASKALRITVKKLKEVE